MQQGALMTLANGVQYIPPHAALPSADELLALATLLYKGGMTSKTVTKPEHLAVKIVAGMEVGFSPVQSCNNIMIVNGKATIYGDGALAIVRASRQLAKIEERIDGNDVEAEAVCVLQRVGEEPREFRFSVADAKRAGLWEKAGPWTDYPHRMLTFRARSFGLRDVFGDILSGLGIFEEQTDIRGAVIDGVTVTSDNKLSKNAEAEPTIDDGFWTRMTFAKEGWLKTLNIDVTDGDLVKREWTGKLALYGVESAKKLTPTLAHQLLNELEESCKPGY